MSIKGTKYIVRRGDFFQLRLPIPKDIQSKLRRKELRRSLKTGDAPTAKRRAFRATLIFMELCDSVRMMQDVSAAQANDIVAAFFRLLVQSYTPPASWKKEPFDQQLHSQIQAADTFATEFADRVEHNEQTNSDLNDARSLLAKFGLDFDRLPTIRQHQIWKGMVRAYAENLNFLEHELSGTTQPFAPDDELFKHIDDLNLIAIAERSLGEGMITQAATPNELSIRAAADIYIETGKSTGTTPKGPWGKTSISVTEKVLAWFCEFVGSSAALRSISKAQCRDFKNRYIQLQLGARPHTSFAKATTTDSSKRISSATAANQFAYLKTFFNWLEMEGYIDINPSSKLNIPVKTKSKDEERRPFTVNEVDLLFSSPLFTGYKSAKRRYLVGNIKPLRDHEFFAPLVLLYTGMRIGEVVNIPLEYVDVDSSSPHFYLRTIDQSLKTYTSVRKVPIHNDLSKFGFHEWVRERKKVRAKSDPLMSGFATKAMLKGEAKTTLEGYYSKKFNSYIDRIVTKDSLLVVHSLRHYAIDCARNAKLPQGLINQIFGHQGQKTVGDGYGHGASLDVLFEQFQTIDFGLSKSVRAQLQKC